MENNFKFENKKTPESFSQEDIHAVFELHPELAYVGSEEEYGKYLKTIFPETTVKSIVWHGTLEQRNIWRNNQHFGTRKAAKDRINFIKQVQAQIDNRGILYPSLINVNNSKHVEDADYAWGSVIENALREGFDGLTYQNNNEGEGDFSYVVFEPENIFILGSEKDIQNFKHFIENKKS